MNSDELKKKLTALEKLKKESVAIDGFLNQEKVREWLADFEERVLQEKAAETYKQCAVSGAEAAEQFPQGSISITPLPPHPYDKTKSICNNMPQDCQACKDIFGRAHEPEEQEEDAMCSMSFPQHLFSPSPEFDEVWLIPENDYNLPVDIVWEMVEEVAKANCTLRPVNDPDGKTIAIAVNFANVLRLESLTIEKSKATIDWASAQQYEHGSLDFWRNHNYETGLLRFFGKVMKQAACFYSTQTNHKKYVYFHGYHFNFEEQYYQNFSITQTLNGCAVTPYGMVDYSNNIQLSRDFLDDDFEQKMKEEFDL